LSRKIGDIQKLIEEAVLTLSISPNGPSSIPLKENGGYFILADGRYIVSRSEGTEPNYRYLHGVKGTVVTRYQAMSLDRGPVPGETRIIVKSGKGWRDYFVAPILNKQNP